MTALAVRGSRHQNGVSRIHGDVSSQMLQDLWPQVPAEENPIDYVTNGVHVPTFLAGEWADVFDRFVGYDWTQHIGDRSCVDAHRPVARPELLERAPVPQVADAAPGALPRAASSTSATRAARPTSTGCSSTPIRSIRTC